MWLVLVDDAYQALERHSGCWRRTRPAPVVHESEVITAVLIIDTWFHRHETLGLALLHSYHPTVFPHLPSDGWFHQRRTRLRPLIAQIQQGINRRYCGVSDADLDQLAEGAPIPVATHHRAREPHGHRRGILWRDEPSVRQALH